MTKDNLYLNVEKTFKYVGNIFFESGMKNSFHYQIEENISNYNGKKLDVLMMIFYQIHKADKNKAEIIGDLHFLDFEKLGARGEDIIKCQDAVALFAASFLICGNPSIQDEASICLEGLDEKILIRNKDQVLPFINLSKEYLYCHVCIDEVLEVLKND